MAQDTGSRYARVQELHARESALRSIVRSPDQIPIAYELISDEWLTGILCSRVPGAAVVGHSLGAADEGTSNRRRILLEYNEAGAKAGLPARVFCKATQSLQSRLVLGLNDCAETEVNFYNRVRPLLDIEAPVGVFANIDRESLNSIVVMRDMGDGVEFCDQNTPMPLARAESQMRLLARFHAACSSKPEMREAIQVFQTLEQFCDKTQRAFDWAAARINGVQAARDVMPKRLYDRAGEIDPATVRAFMRHAELPRTLLHSDVHLRNWYVAANGEMGLADWQILARGNGARDLAYTISTALTIENRRAWEVHLIRYYLDRLREEGASAPSFDETMLLYRQQLLCAMGMWTSTLTPAPGSPEMQPPETSLEFIRRMSHAIDDLDALDSIPR